MKLLLTSAGISNNSIRDALVEVLGSVGADRTAKHQKRTLDPLTP
jgi:hypothetical protein